MLNLRVVEFIIVLLLPRRVVVKVLIIIIRHLNNLRIIILLSTTCHFDYNAMRSRLRLTYCPLPITLYIILCVVCFGGWFVLDKCITFSSPIAPPFIAVPRTHVCTRGYIVSAIDQYRGHLKCFIYGRFIIFPRNY